MIIRIELKQPKTLKNKPKKIVALSFALLNSIKQLANTHNNLIDVAHSSNKYNAASLLKTARFLECEIDAKLIGLNKIYKEIEKYKGKKK